MATVTHASDFINELANLRHRIQFAEPGTFLHIHDASIRLLACLLRSGLHLTTKESSPKLTLGTGLSPSHLVLHYSDRAPLLEALQVPPPGLNEEAAARQACLDELYLAFKSRCTAGHDTPGWKTTCAVVLHRLELKSQPWITPDQARELLAASLPRATRARLNFDSSGKCQSVQELHLASDTDAALPFEMHWFQGRTLENIGDEVRRALGAHVAHHQVDAGPIRFFADEFHNARRQFAVRFLIVPPAPGGNSNQEITAWMAIQLLPAAANNGHGSPDH